MKYGIQIIAWLLVTVGTVGAQSGLPAVQQDIQVMQQEVVTNNVANRESVLSVVDGAVAAYQAIPNPCGAAPGTRFVVTATTICDSKSGATFTRTMAPVGQVYYSDDEAYCAMLAPVGTWELPSMEAMATLADTGGQIITNWIDWVNAIGFLNVSAMGEHPILNFARDRYQYASEFRRGYFWISYATSSANRFNRYAISTNVNPLSGQIFNSSRLCTKKLGQ